MNAIPFLTLNDGRRMPALGLGVYGIPDSGTGAAIGTAIASGYRLIDTASIYGNEKGVGAAVCAASVPRAELFVTTKVWNDRHGHDPALKAFAESLGRLGLDYVDLYLIHWPVARKDAFVATWKALIRLRDEGMVKSIGVSNFTIANLARLCDETGIVPAVNQIEVHLEFQQRALREYHSEHGIITESWSPIGHGHFPEGGVLARLSAKYGKTRAQVALRWHVQNGLLPIPKSATPSRIRENRDVFDFALTAEELGELAGLERGGRRGPDPETFS